MSLPHVLLGLLAEAPRTGYDLTRAIRDELAPFFRAELSQIYPALARLRRAGFVVLRVLGPRRGPPRNLYRVTAAGRRELRRWVAEPAPAPRGRDEGLARIAFLEALPLPQRRETLLGYERTIAEEIRRLRGAPELLGYRREARRGAVERLEAVRRWLRALAQQAASPSPAEEKIRDRSLPLTGSPAPPTRR